jgi:hypothetical protein
MIGGSEQRKGLPFCDYSTLKIAKR